MPVSDPTAQADVTSRWTALSWGAYLASSWTWCIGMFLPVILLRDFGPLSFAAFAVPNVIGAAAMGWVLRTRAASDEAVARHSRAAVWFSVVTLLFQVFFLAAMTQWPFAVPAGVRPVLIGVVALMTFAAAFSYGRALGLVAYLLSLGIAIVYLALGGWPTPATWVSGLTPGNSADAAAGLVWLTPVTCFGFLLCPYLDLTFHKARAALDPAGSRVAFSVGFGVLFFSMIVFTLAYAGEFLGRPSAGGAAAFALVLIHIALQASFTAGIHLRAVANRPRAGGGGVRSPAWWVCIGAIGGLLFLFYRVLAGVPADGAGPPEIGAGFEFVYRLFMSFYGLVFPAYVWLCMIPTRDGVSGPTPRRLAVWVLAVAIAAPAFWMGFIEGENWWLGPGLGVVLLARLALPRRAAARA